MKISLSLSLSHYLNVWNAMIGTIKLILFLAKEKEFYDTCLMYYREHLVFILLFHAFL